MDTSAAMTWTARCTFARLLLPLLLVLVSSRSLGQMPADATVFSGKRKTISPVLSLSKVSYKGKNSTEFDIDRKTLGLDFGLPLSHIAEATISGGYILKSKYGDIDKEGDGYVFGFGAKSLVHKTGSSAIAINGSFSLQSEQIKYSDFRVEYDSSELHIGSTLMFAESRKLLPYLGLDLTLLSDGSYKLKAPPFSGTVKYERSNILSLRLGIIIPVGHSLARAEAILVSERTVTFALAIPI